MYFGDVDTFNYSVVCRTCHCSCISLLGLELQSPEQFYCTIQQGGLRVVYGVGGCLLFISIFCGITAFCRPRIKTCSVFAAVFCVQVVADICLVVALAIFPLSFKSEFFQQFCGTDAHFYNKGYCSLGWPLYTAMVAASFSLYLPALAIFSMNISDGLRGNICC
ncbi:hypothetical protein EMCRGX_G023800 [Ephydatia muelleri]